MWTSIKQGKMLEEILCLLFKYKTYHYPEKFVMFRGAGLSNIVEEYRELRQIDGITNPRSNEKSSPRG